MIQISYLTFVKFLCRSFDKICIGNEEEDDDDDDEDCRDLDY